MEEQDLKDWQEFKNDVKNQLNQKQYKLLCTLHAKIFKHKYSEPCPCAKKRMRKWISDIDNIYRKTLE